MKKVFKFGFMLMGFIAFTFGGSSCSKKHECCNYTDSYGDSYKFCEDHAGFTEDSWKSYKSYIQSEYNAVCEEEKI